MSLCSLSEDSSPPFPTTTHSPLSPERVSLSPPPHSTIASRVEADLPRDLSCFQVPTRTDDADEGMSDVNNAEIHEQSGPRHHVAHEEERESAFLPRAAAARLQHAAPAAAVGKHAVIVKQEYKYPNAAGQKRARADDDPTHDVFKDWRPRSNCTSSTYAATVKAPLH